MNFREMRLVHFPQDLLCRITVGQYIPIETLFNVCCLVKVDELNSLQCSLLFYFAFTNYYVVVPLLFEICAKQEVRVLTTKRVIKEAQEILGNIQISRRNITHALQYEIVVVESSSYK